MQVPLLGNAPDLILKFSLASLGFLDVLRRDAWVKALCVSYRLSDQVTLEIHETVKTFVFLDLKDEDVGFFLGSTQLDGESASIVTGLLSQVV